MISYEELVLKSVFSILLEKKHVLEVEKEFIKKLNVELNISNDIFNKIHNDWINKPGIPIGMTFDDNITILSYMVYSAFVKNSFTDKETDLLNKYAVSIGINNFNVNLFITIIKPDLSIKNNIENIKRNFNNKNSETPTQSKPKDRKRLYIATQITKEGLDEIQSLSMCYKLSLNVALDGLPGIGKTQSVIELSEIFGLKLFTKTCSSRTSESHIISHPILTEKNGVSITEHANGPLVLAMITPGVFYGDEYNLLKEDVQKRMNSAFDERRSIDKNDGEIIKSKDGFFSIISYNPSKDMSSRDLEDSVADRFVHFHYNEWISDLKAYISMKKTKQNNNTLKYSDFGIKLEERGISKDGSFFIKDEVSGKWLDFFKKTEAKKEPDFIYYAHSVKNLNQNDKEGMKALDILSEKSFSEIELARVFSKFSELINELTITGNSPILNKIGLDNINSSEDAELLQVHRTSTRIISAALKHYHHLITLGFNKYLAQSYSTSIIINQMCYGTYRDIKLKETSNYELVMSIAKAFGLFADSKTYNTSFIRENLL